MLITGFGFLLYTRLDFMNGSSVELLSCGALELVVPRGLATTLAISAAMQ